MDVLTGNVAVKVTTTERHIATSTLAVEMLCDYLLRYNGQSGEWKSLISARAFDSRPQRKRYSAVVKALSKRNSLSNS